MNDHLTRPAAHWRAAEELIAAQHALGDGTGLTLAQKLAFFRDPPIVYPASWKRERPRDPVEAGGGETTAERVRRERAEAKYLAARRRLMERFGLEG